MIIHRPNQKGFAAIEALLIVAVVAIVGGTGYYVYHANKKTSDTLNSASQVAQSSPQAHKKKKASSTPQASASSAPAVDDKSAILAAIKAKIEPQPVINQDNGQQITFTYTVDEISGVNARGSIRASEGDPMKYIAQKQNGSWKIIYEGHLYPSSGTCTQYSLPSSWCM